MGYLFIASPYNEVIGSLSEGEGSKDIIESSKGCTPILRKDAPIRIGETFRECIGLVTIFLIADQSL